MGFHLRVFSGNLKNGAADPDAFADLVQSYGADIVAVQELGHDQADALNRVFPHGRLEPSHDYTGMGIALRNPGSLDRVTLAYRDARIARIDPEHWPDLHRPLEIVNVHIASPTIGYGLSGILRRRAQIRQLCGYLDATAGRTRIALGDFNATPTWPAYRAIRARLEDLAVSYARQRHERPARTWTRWVGGTPLFRIDHCFGHGVAVNGFEVVAIQGSDHSGIVADLSVK
jgi:endonuclease/exonuclease/phosphatase family metal-dependent hydrolase